MAALHCEPTAWRLLVEARVSFEHWNVGRCEAVFASRVAAMADTELGGYQVFAALDVPAVVAEVIATLGGVPRFT